jgi:hypothetical protein
MTTFEKCRFIRDLLVRRAAEVMTYQNWSHEFASQQIRDVPTDILTRYPELSGIQPSELTDAECESLGFGRWSQENPMRLIPLWLLPFLADEIKTTSISGGAVLRKADMDNDNRFGCLAYGIMPADSTPDIDTDPSNGGETLSWLGGRLLARLRDDHAAQIDKIMDERRWIPVEERLPAVGARVLILWDACEHEIAIYTSDAYWAVLAKNIPTNRVTHWMPLPKIPPERTPELPPVSAYATEVQQ